MARTRAWGARGRRFESCLSDTMPTRVASELRQLLQKLYTAPQYQSYFPISINWNQGEFLVQLLKQYRPKRVLELGSGYGISAIWIQLGLPTTSKHVSVDPWAEHPALIKKALKSTKHILTTQFTSQQYLAKLETQKNQPKPDFIVMDADNRFDGCISDFYFANHLQKPGDVIIMRNCWNPSVRMAARFVVTNLPYRLVGVPSVINWWMQHLHSIGLGWLLYHTTKRYTAEWVVLEKTASDTRPWHHFRRFW